MINVKLTVLFLCVSLISSYTKYCEICQNHILCKYKMSGPSSSCKEYDETSRLTKEDVANIVNKINERRNYIASGLSRLLPKAANMKKVFWSEELSVFAQRWVDQCDQNTRPDKEDECRDLEDTEVSQNIVSVSGPTPGMIVRSLIDVWFTEGFDYKSSVSYYNNTRDWKTNYFTQLIWGETDRVGCGKAKFYVDNKNTMIERLVCNFAPKGNIHGKPVYAVGYPATQCNKNMTSDKKYPSLCTYVIDNNVRKSTPRSSPVSSLLRILNLSNNSVMKDMDPVKTNIKKVKVHNNETNQQRNQKIRHVFPNNVARKRIPQNNSNNYIRNHPQPANLSRSERLKFQEKGNSRVYHEHDLNFRTIDQDYKKYKHATEPLTFESHYDRYKKYERNHECTRKNIPIYNVPNNPTNEFKSKSSQCTRRHITEKCNQTTEKCQDNKVKADFHDQFPHEQCLCNTPTTCPTTPSQCQCNANCPCFKPDFSTKIYPLIQRRKSDLKYETRKAADFHYYDLYPKLIMRSGVRSREIVDGLSREPWLQQESTVDNYFQSFPYSLKKYNHGDESHHKQETDYIYDSTNSRERIRRNPTDEMTFKPFWQMDELRNQRTDQLKSLLYTTLQNKKQKKSKLTTFTVRTPQTTETITVKLKDSSNSFQPLKNAVTEKYLSFDELMHLRRFEATATNIVVNGRRNELTTTSEYTTNTPFERIKHCTRKLTCTWTAISITDANGSVIGPGIDSDRGSRTPPGYVEGCTRTSTCTRDYLEKNKFSTLPEDSGESDDTSEDEEYCEKRSLNIHKRESGSKLQVIYLPQTYTVLNLPTQYSVSEHEEVTTPISFFNCDCPTASPRIKRNKNFSLNIRQTDEKEKSLYENLSYGDLYHLALQKVMSNWKNSQNINGMNTCLCSRSYLLKSSFYIKVFIFIYFLSFILNLFS